MAETKKSALGLGSLCPFTKLDFCSLESKPALLGDMASAPPAKGETLVSGSVRGGDRISRPQSRCLP